MSDKPLKIVAGTPDKPWVVPGTDIEINCYVLEDEARVSSRRGMIASPGMKKGSAMTGDRLTGFVDGNAIKPFVSGEMRAVITNPVKFEVSGTTAFGYPATLLADICDAVIQARNADVLQKRQTHIADHCEVPCGPSPRSAS